MGNRRHQYVERHTGRVIDEKLYGDTIVNLIYSHVRESAPQLFRALTSARISSLLGFINFDSLLSSRLFGASGFLRESGVDLSECVENCAVFSTARAFFERKIRYWECRPMPGDPRIVVSPADSRVIVGSLAESSPLFLKGKFFDADELLGPRKEDWARVFQWGAFAVFRLTPEKYHYNHTPVAGCVVDFYEIDGPYHSCNPGAVVALATPYSKNKRVVTLMDTDVAGGSQVGLVAMVEIVALMIGDIVQCYSEERYEAPRPVRKGDFLRKGVPKSLYRPGSSTDVLLFQEERVEFAPDLLRNTGLPGVQSRFSMGFGKTLVETELKVRSPIARPAGANPEGDESGTCPWWR